VHTQREVQAHIHIVWLALVNLSVVMVECTLRGKKECAQSHLRQIIVAAPAGSRAVDVGVGGSRSERRVLACAYHGQCVDDVSVVGVCGSETNVVIITAEGSWRAITARMKLSLRCCDLIACQSQ
jgi:hypothetical protein